jgi:hypothetical protein
MTLCMLMTISLLWTLSFLIAAGNDPVGKLNSEPSKQTQTALSYSWNATAVSSASSHDDLRPISVGHDYGSPSRYDPGPGLDYTTSIEDFLYSGSGQVNYIESSHILDSRPESETLLIDDNSIHESFSDQWKRQPSPSPAFSSLSDTPAFTMAPSATKSATTWTTHLPARSTSQPEEAYRPVSLQSQRESCVQSPSSKFLPDLKRAWSRRFNIGHLTMRITSLTIISG